jgi:hypothetical protein
MCFIKSWDLQVIFLYESTSDPNHTAKSTVSTVQDISYFRTTGPPASDPRRASVSGDLVSSSWERTGRRSPANQRRHASAREAGCPAPRSPRCLLMTPGGASVESVFEDPEEETYSYLEVG